MPHDQCTEKFEMGHEIWVLVSSGLIFWETFSYKIIDEGRPTHLPQNSFPIDVGLLVSSYDFVTLRDCL